MKISVITATYQSEHCIEQTLQSIYRQTYKNYEHIIIDGGSTDNTKKIIGKYKKNIAKFVSEKDNGIYDAFNKGINLSSGDIIYFLNSDDYLIHDDVFAQVIAKFNDPTLVGVYGKIVYRQEEIDFVEPFETKFITLDMVNRGILPPHPALFLRKSVFDNLGKFNLKYTIAADMDFSIKAYLHYGAAAFGFIDKWFLMHRYGGVSTNLLGYDKVRLESNEIFEHYGIPVRFQINNADKLMIYYQKWIEILLFGKRGITNLLQNDSVGSMAVVGLGKVSNYVIQDLKLSNINPVCFCDLLGKIGGGKILDVPIVTFQRLEQLLKNKEIGCVMIGFSKLQNDQAYEAITGLFNQNKVKQYCLDELLINLKVDCQ